MKKAFSSFIGILLLATMLVSMLTGCGLQVPRPEIKKGEFAFTVTYELHGEVKTVSDVYVCEYDGIGWTLDGGHYRVWRGYFKSGIEESFEIDRIGDDVLWLDLDFYPAYFMGDPDWEWRGAPEPDLSVGITDDEGFYFECDTEIIEETYGAKLIGCEYDEPIVNSFSIFN